MNDDDTDKLQPLLTGDDDTTERGCVRIQGGPTAEGELDTKYSSTYAFVYTGGAVRLDLAGYGLLYITVDANARLDRCTIVVNPQGDKAPRYIRRVSVHIGAAAMRNCVINVPAHPHSSGITCVDIDDKVIMRDTVVTADSSSVHSYVGISSGAELRGAIVQSPSRDATGVRIGERAYIGAATINATVGSHCVVSDGANICADIDAHVHIPEDAPVYTPVANLTPGEPYILDRAMIKTRLMMSNM